MFRFGEGIPFTCEVTDLPDRCGTGTEIASPEAGFQLSGADAGRHCIKFSQRVVIRITRRLNLSKKKVTESTERFALRGAISVLR